MSVGLIISGCTAVAIAAAAAFFLARKLAAAKRAKDALRIQNSIDRVPVRDQRGTTELMRQHRF